MSDDFPLPVPSPSVVFKQLDEGGVLLSTSEEVYFGVNAVGARIWSLLPPTLRTFEDMCSALYGEYSDVGAERIRKDARSFLRDLVSAGLASPVPEGGGDAGEPSGDSPQSPEAS